MIEWLNSLPDYRKHQIIPLFGHQNSKLIFKLKFELYDSELGHRSK